MHSMIHDTGAGFWLGHSLMVIFIIAVFTLILAGAYLVLNALLGEAQSNGNEPLQALAHQYTRGEIDRDEFLRRQQELLDYPNPKT
ncbi:SHOCT domain-containing protein [Aquisalimonas sp.]|uniref:SHOCT domain-containing protein n=1 Tax=unclassified Aquisalimonas TaxID=2644645 RepID=UPI0025C10235|nr:SHOCT domain-containing protein [Aquisalimonas sp.]